MDKLERIFEMQECFQKDLIERRNLHDIPMDKWIQMQTLAMLSELAELIDEVNFKWWKNPKPVEENKVKEELVDILHFFVSMCLTSGMSAQELFDRYIEKNQENFDRQNGLSQKKGYESPAAGEKA
jgi:dimeric dUTPase (all-alpha-NTP-PPase superfamily)